jgi:hypothetical protein
MSDGFLRRWCWPLLPGLSIARGRLFRCLVCRRLRLCSGEELAGHLRIRVSWTIQSFAVCEDLLVKVDGPTEVVRKLIGVREITACGDGLGMISAKNASIIGDGTLVQLDRAGKVAEVPVTTGQVGPGVERVRVVRAVDTLAVGEIALMQIERADWLVLQCVEVCEVGPAEPVNRCGTLGDENLGCWVLL